MILSSGGLCSGALIQPDLILTAAHCVYRLRAVHVSWHDNPRVFEPATVVGLNKKADIALIQLERKSERKPLVLLTKGQRMPEGSPIATIGHPSIGEFLSNPPFDLDMTYLMSTGIVSGVTTDDLISDMSVSPGNSGGPVLNDRGEVIGVVSRKRVDRYVGAIGFSANLNKAYELIENFNEHKNPPITWKHASTATKFYLAYTYQPFMKEFNEGNTGVWVGGFSFDFWDRLRLEIADNLSTTRRYKEMGIGYKFAFEMNNHNLVYLTPTVSSLLYEIRPDENTRFEHNIFGVGMNLQASGMPLGLKIIGFQFDGKYYGVTALQLVF